jgi:hypothetical protein
MGGQNDTIRFVCRAELQRKESNVPEPQPRVVTVDPCQILPPVWRVVTGHTPGGRSTIPTDPRHFWSHRTPTLHDAILFDAPAE